MEGTSTQVMDIGICQSNPLIATAHTTRIERERRDQDLQSDVLISTVTGWIEGERDGNFIIQARVTAPVF